MGITDSMEWSVQIINVRSTKSLIMALLMTDKLDEILSKRGETSFNNHTNVPSRPEKKKKMIGFGK